jgi:hypothetical protein
MLFLMLKAEVARRKSLQVRDAFTLAGVVCAKDPSEVLMGTTADSHPLVHAMWADGRLMWLRLGKSLHKSAAPRWVSAAPYVVCLPDLCGVYSTWLWCVPPVCLCVGGQVLATPPPPWLRCRS